MTYTRARCGHQVCADGSPGSAARRACESRACGAPRCESGLPTKFTDRECAAYVWLWKLKVGPWTVDLLTKNVKTPETGYANLIEFAQYHGREG
jgi:hypothetical protein